MTLQALDVVVLTHDLPDHGLKRGDLGAVVDVYAADAMEVEFVTASGRTQALVTLRPSDVREVGDDDLVTVRPTGSSLAAFGVALWATLIGFTVWLAAGDES